jgi:hypothetical protein
MEQGAFLLKKDHANPKVCLQINKVTLVQPNSFWVKA